MGLVVCSYTLCLAAEFTELLTPHLRSGQAENLFSLRVLWRRNFLIGGVLRNSDVDRVNKIPDVDDDHEDQQHSHAQAVNEILHMRGDAAAEDQFRE